ncbi:MAG: hypothetical protein P8Y97_03350 [Candidatus Lokiarchaeota archaeon]
MTHIPFVPGYIPEKVGENRKRVKKLTLFGLLVGIITFLIVLLCILLKI